MTNNDILRRLRHALDINDTKVAEIIGKTGEETSRSQVSRWLKREDEEGCKTISDATLCRFLMGSLLKNEVLAPMARFLCLWMFLPITRSSKSFESPWKCATKM